MFEQFLNKVVMIRSDRAGVHYGILKGIKSAQDGFDIILHNARRVYSWSGAFTLSELSQIGPIKTGSKISIEIPAIGIRGIEVLPMTDIAKTALDKCEFKI